MVAFLSGWIFSIVRVFFIVLVFILRCFLFASFSRGWFLFFAISSSILIVIIISFLVRLFWFGIGLTFFGRFCGRVSACGFSSSFSICWTCIGSWVWIFIGITLVGFVVFVLSIMILWVSLRVWRTTLIFF